MANMYISEYAEQAVDGNGNAMQAGKEPALTTQVVPFTTTHGQSAPFNGSTTFVRITLDTKGYCLFASDPTAVTATHMPMSADVPEYFGIQPRATLGLKISAVE